MVIKSLQLLRLSTNGNSYENGIRRTWAGTDLLCAIFVDELLATYPDAKIILTTRSVNSWYRSMMNTIYPARHHGFVYTAYHKLFKTRYGLTEKMFNTFWEHFFYDNFPKFGKQVYNAHNNYVRAIAPSDRFLEFEVGDGWKPLCEFLNKDVPKKPWSKTNDTATFQKNFSQKQKRMLSIALDASLVVLPVLAIASWKWATVKKAINW
ncbi:hypothetical protein VTL71DRAFT_15542 [Oculimacula yallundae]|uniref:Sulfotransferase n=1 Tax=Oculimacula yallundae TaxID=86028 RepID=A0ABR4CGW4_9HELO